MSCPTLPISLWLSQIELYIYNSACNSNIELARENDQINAIVQKRDSRQKTKSEGSLDLDSNDGLCPTIFFC